MNYTRLLLRIKDSAFLFKTAESPSLYNGIGTFYCQDACAFKRKKKRCHENHHEESIQWLEDTCQITGMQFLKRTNKPGHVGKIESPRKKCSSHRIYNRTKSFIDFCFNFKDLRNLSGLPVHPSNYSLLDFIIWVSLRLLILRKVATN